MDRRNRVRRIRAVVMALVMIVSLSAGIPAGSVMQVQAAALSNPRKGTNGVVTWDCVYFGRYPQSDATGSSTDAIKWRVLSVSGQDAFLVADCNLDVYHYYDAFENITWAKSLVRSWLNGYGYSSNPRSEDFRNKGFIDKAFTETERESIYTTTVVTSNNPEAGNSVGGDNTNDKIFLLSYEEVTNSAYGFASADSEDPARIRTNTAYVGAGGIGKSNYTKPAGQSGCWWLRSPGSFNNNAMYIGEAGYTHVDGYGVETGYFAICPALHLNLSNSNIWSYAGTVSSDGSSTAGENPPSEQQRNGSSVTVTSITAVKTKTVYKTTDTWSTKDITVTATYSDGHTETVADGKWTCSSLDIKEAGDKQLDITYDGVKTSITIKVYEPVKITTQPVSQTVTAGEKASFSIQVSGTAPYTYQWMKSLDGETWNAISNARSASYTTGQLQVSDDATQYKCVVTNGEGAAKTEVASEVAEVRVGTIQVQHTGKDMTVRYAGSEIDVSQCFELDSRVSGALYNLLEGSGLLDGTQLIVSRPGTFRLRVWTQEQGNYAAASAEAALTVLPALVTNVGKDAMVPYTSGKKVDVRNYFTLDSNAGLASYSVQGPDGNSVEITRYMLTIQQPGIYTIQVHTVPEDELYEEGTATAVLTVGENLISATITGYTGVYDGKGHSLQIDKEEDTDVLYSEDGENYVEEQPVYTNAGTYTVYYKLKQDGKEDVTGSQTIEITKRPLTIKAKNQTIVLGEELNLTGQYTQTGLADGDVMESVLLTPSTQSLTDDGSIYPSDAVIYNDDAEDVTGNYNITYQNGRLVITQEPVPVVGIPEVTVQPEDQEVQAGESVEFVVEADGGELQYQWMISPDQQSWEEITGANERTYRIERATVAQTDSWYRCRIWNDTGDTLSDMALLTVNRISVTNRLNGQAKTTLPYNVVDGKPIDVLTYFVLGQGAGTVSCTWKRKGTDDPIALLDTTMLTIEETGTYEVTLHTAENGDYASAEPVTAEFTVKKGTIDYTAENVTVSYDGKPHSLKVEVTEPKQAEVQYYYSADGRSPGEYTAEVPEFVQEGTYTVYYRIEKPNYQTVEASGQVKIGAAGSEEEQESLPVQNKGTDTTVEYSGKTIDVRNVFQLDANAGTATYVLTSAGTGKGTLQGYTLQVRSAGTFFVKLRTAAHGTYAEGEAAAVITVTKGRGTGTVTIRDIVYGEYPAPWAESVTNGTDAVTWLYRRMGDPEYVSDLPTEIGSYKVRAVFAETDLYQECMAEAVFRIKASGEEPEQGTLEEQTTVSDPSEEEQEPTTVSDPSEGTQGQKTVSDPLDGQKAVSVSSDETEEQIAITEKQKSQNAVTLNAKTSAKWSGGSISLKWGAVDEADGYDIFAAKAGGSGYELAASVTDGDKTAVKLSKLAGKTLDTRSIYRLCVRAYCIVNGDKQYIAMGQQLYLAGSKHTKYTNAKSVRVNKTTCKLKKGEQMQIKAVVVKQKRSKKLLPAKYGKSLRYTSTNEAIATVSAKGKIKAKKKGSCYIYVTALNGVNRKIRVTIK